MSKIIIISNCKSCPNFTDRKWDMDIEEDFCKDANVFFINTDEIPNWCSLEEVKK